MDKVNVTVARLGKAVVEQWERPVPGEHQILIRTEYTAISTGTETKSLRSKSNGIRLGYNAVGIIVEKGAGVEHLEIGQRVACYGEGSHAEYSLVSKFLAAPVPDSVDPEEAAFAGLGAIAIHALHQAEMQFGETAVLVGLGILGQIAAQIANAAAHRVIGFDIQPMRCRMLEPLTPEAIVCNRVEDVTSAVQHAESPGADSVMLFGGGKDDGLIDQGIQWLRDRGKIVIVGIPDTTFARNALFVKEAQIRICRAGGPGRYDAKYEQAGFDYPDGYVRWTEGRNVGKFIRLLAEKRINLKPLIRHRFEFAEIDRAYQLCLDAPAETMGVLIRY